MNKNERKEKEGRKKKSSEEGHERASMMNERERECEHEHQRSTCEGNTIDRSIVEVADAAALALLQLSPISQSMNYLRPSFFFIKENPKKEKTILFYFF